MLYLFDASSIVNLVKRGLAKVFIYGETIDLALYEALNAIWKEYTLVKKIDKETALEYINILIDVFTAIEKVDIHGFEREVFDIASREKLTLYDASYLYIAIKHKLVLVTDDKELREKARKYVKVLNSREIADKYMEYSRV